MTTILQLPITQSDAYFGFTCELDGVSYSFAFRWNDRVGAWFMDVGDGEGTVLVAGIRVVLNLNLLARYNRADLPPGPLLAFDTEGSNFDAGFADLGRRVVLLYGGADS